MTAEVWANFITSLKIMGQGMGGVFAAAALIALLVLALERIK